MKKETPRSSKRRAGLAIGLKDSGARHGMPTTGRDHRQKRSPKEQSAVSGTLIQVSQVVLDRPGRDHATRRAKGDGSAPASKIARRHWDQPSHSWLGLVVLCLRLGLSPTSMIFSQQLRS